VTGLPPRCWCGGPWRREHLYRIAPSGEVRFPQARGHYRREILRCAACGHFRSRHCMNLHLLYRGDYVDATYGPSGLEPAFHRILSLDSKLSDNAGRVDNIESFWRSHFRGKKRGRVLDVGSGLCVFLHRMKIFGWQGTALDPDLRAVLHARKVVGVRTLHGHFPHVAGLGKYDLITFNKVLEHLSRPIPTLRAAANHLCPGGYVYVELPDGEAAAREGFFREEFFIDHHHVFSIASFVGLAVRAGFDVVRLERLREPSTKYTLRAFLTPRPPSEIP
jgi:SAM-dependent methyltransferase